MVATQGEESAGAGVATAEGPGAVAVEGEAGWQAAQVATRSAADARRATRPVEGRTSSAYPAGAYFPLHFATTASNPWRKASSFRFLD